MISGTASTVAWPAGESTGPSWSRIATPGRSALTIPVVICVAERAGSQSVALIGFGVTAKPIAASAAVVAALTLRNGGRTTLNVYGAPSASKRAAVSVISNASVDAGMLLRFGWSQLWPSTMWPSASSARTSCGLASSRIPRSKKVAGTPFARRCASVAGR